MNFLYDATLYKWKYFLNKMSKMDEGGHVALELTRTEAFIFYLSLY